MAKKEPERLDPNTHSTAFPTKPAYTPKPSTPKPQFMGGFGGKQNKAQPQAAAPKELSPAQKALIYNVEQASAGAPGKIEPDPFFSLEGQKARWQNVIQTVGEAAVPDGMKPWIKENLGINIAMDTQSDNALAKWLANNPYEAALYIANIFHLSRAALRTGLQFAAGRQVTWQMVSGKTVGKTVFNPRTASFVGELMKQAGFSGKMLAFSGAWAGSVSMGMWGHTEAIEAITIPMTTKYIPEAMRTNDWSLVDEGTEALHEVTDMTLWDRMFLWSPLSAVKGTYEKVKLGAIGAKVLEKFTTDIRKKIDTDQDNVSFWNERTNETTAGTQAIKDTFNEDRITTEKEILALRAAAQDESRREEWKFIKKQSQFWIAHKNKILALEKKAMEEQAEFWLKYREMAQEVTENLSPSHLNFGLV